MITQISVPTPTKDPLTNGDACGGRSHRQIIATIVNQSDYSQYCSVKGK